MCVVKEKFETSDSGEILHFGIGTGSTRRSGSTVIGSEVGDC